MNASPCHLQRNVLPLTGQSSSEAPRCGQAPGPANNRPSPARQSTSSRPATVRTIDLPALSSPDAPTTYQPPGSRDNASESAAAMRSGSACRQVGASRSRGVRGIRTIGMRAGCADSVRCGAVRVIAVRPWVQPAPPTCRRTVGPMARTVIVGAGVGGLAAGVRLAAAGHRVTICEAQPVAGGKLGRHVADTSPGRFVFDTGPTLLTLPRVFDELFADTGSALSDVLPVRRLDTIATYRFADGTRVDTVDDLARQRDAFDAALGDGAGAAWQARRRPRCRDLARRRGAGVRDDAVDPDRAGARATVVAPGGLARRRAAPQPAGVGSAAAARIRDSG